MAKDKPTLPLGTAREMARVELDRWTRVLEVLTAAATLEDQQADRARKLEAFARDVEAAHAERDAALATATQRVEEAVTAADLRIATAIADAVAAERERTRVVTGYQAEIDAKQAELTQIGRDEDAARQARAEYAGLLAEVQALRTERDQLVEKLTR